MIRQAISCDICGAEKRQTNHWFVAYEQDGELRVSGWTSRRRLRPGSKHLCGQTCLHKLVDEFIANSVVLRAQHAAEVGEAEAGQETPARARAATDTSPATAEAEIEIESSARLIAPSEPVPSRPTYRAQPEIVTMPPRPFAMDPSPAHADTSRYTSRRWHTEAWERERERELRSIENRADIAARRRTSA